MLTGYNCLEELQMTQHAQYVRTKGKIRRIFQELLSLLPSCILTDLEFMPIHEMIVITKLCQSVFNLSWCSVLRNLFWIPMLWMLTMLQIKLPCMCLCCMICSLLSIWWCPNNFNVYPNLHCLRLIMIIDSIISKS